MPDGGDLWPLVTVFGVLLLGAVLAWAMMRNAGRDKRMDVVTEAATRAQYASDEGTGSDAPPSPSDPALASDGTPVKDPKA